LSKQKKSSTFLFLCSAHGRSEKESIKILFAALRTARNASVKFFANRETSETTLWRIGSPAKIECFLDAAAK